MSPRVTPFLHAPSNTFCYLVGDEASGEAAIIDPCLDFDPKSGRTGTASIAEVDAALAARGWTLRWILETHAHADHLSAAPWLKLRHPAATLCIGEGIRTVQARFRDVFNLGADFPVDGSQFDRLLADDERLALGGIEIRCIAVPGHTSDSLAYLIGDALFTGDSLFMPDGGSARCDFPGGDAAQLYRSIQRLFALPDATRVYICHDYGPNGRALACETTIGEQRRANIHLREGTREEDFVTRRRARDATLDMPALLLPAVQVNIRAGRLPEQESNGVRYLKLPLDAV